MPVAARADYTQRMRLLPLLPEHESQGARLTDAAGVRLPADYGDAVAEARAARAGAALTDLTWLGRLAVRGPDRQSFLQGQSSNDLKQLAAGDGIDTTFLTGKGKLRGDAVVVARDDELLLLVADAARAPLRDHLQGFVIMDDVTVVDRTEETVELGVVGPAAAAAVQDVLGWPLADLRRNHARPCALDGAAVLAVRVARCGPPGLSLIAGTDAGRALFARLAEALPLAGFDALEVLRVEAGRPRFGADMDEDTLPPEVGFGDAIDYDKGCFTGYEVVARIRTYGHVNWNLVGLRMAGGDAPAAGTAVVDGDGKPVGRVTSSVVSDLVGAALALARVRREVAAPGTALTVEPATGAAVAAEVTALPFPGSAS